MAETNTTQELKAAAETVYKANADRLAKLQGATDYLGDGEHYSESFETQVDLALGAHILSGMKKARGDFIAFEIQAGNAQNAMTNAEAIKAVLDQRFQQPASHHS